MNRTLKQLHHCVALIVQLKQMFNVEQSEHLHRILRCVQNEIKLLVPHNPSLQTVSQMYLNIKDLRSIDSNLLVHQYSDELLDNMKTIICMTDGNDNLIHDIIEAIDTR
jgi:hypothetical protein